MNQHIVNVLLVDDIAENLMALAALLARPDVCAHTATSANEALELLLQHEFALAVIDVQMPEVSGFELAEMMRSTERTRHIPIVFVSAGSAEPGYTLKGYDCGAIDFLYKPLDGTIVKSKVNVFVDLYRQRLELDQQIVALRQSQSEQVQLLLQLQKTEDELRDAMRLRDDFMSVVSHELRTPLNALKLELYTRRLMLENNTEGAFTSEKIDTMISNDERQLDRIVRLINDMTDVSRIRTGQLSIRVAQTNVAALVKRILEQFSAQIAMADSSAQFESSSPRISAQVDEVRIEQAIINLLTNAIRHCGAKPIDVSVTELNDTQVRIAVRDYGKGIEPEDHQRIFELFERGTHERKGSGLGLGLFIANQIVRAHGGTLAVESRPQEGSLFMLTLPKRFEHSPD